MNSNIICNEYLGIALINSDEDYTLAFSIYPLTLSIYYFTDETRLSIKIKLFKLEFGMFIGK